MTGHVNDPLAPPAAKAEKVRAGFYRCGSYCIHKNRYQQWIVYLRDKPVDTFYTAKRAIAWCEQNPATGEQR